MKEMVGGCCVCSDERGWPDNPLVYCDGNGCTVAVHQACYGIVTVPTGPWYCRKCESPETSKGKVRCELCPSRSGALKKADTGGWAHVVCALYIPEVRFGNVTSMEPIVLRLIPPERFTRTCYICTENGKAHRASQGACMACNKSGCKQQFHVTCAQSLGLLCEEAGNYLDNVKYCGYCQHHYSKLKKGGNVKTIPPYKPVAHDSQSSESSSEKEEGASPMPGGSGTPSPHTKGSKGPGRKSSQNRDSSKNLHASKAAPPITPQPMDKKKSPSRRQSSTGDGPSTSKTSTPAPSPSHSADLGHSSKDKKSPSRRHSSTGDGPSSSKTSTPAPSPSHSADLGHSSKASGSSSERGRESSASRSTPPSASPGASKSPQTSGGVISSVASATAASTAPVPATSSSITTSVVQSPSTKLSSVITNTDALETKHTKKRKAAAAAASAAAEQAAQPNANGSPGRQSAASVELESRNSKKRRTTAVAAAPTAAPTAPTADDAQTTASGDPQPGTSGTQWEHSLSSSDAPVPMDAAEKIVKKAKTDSNTPPPAHYLSPPPPPPPPPPPMRSPRHLTSPMPGPSSMNPPALMNPPSTIRSPSQHQGSTDMPAPPSPHVFHQPQKPATMDSGIPAQSPHAHSQRSNWGGLNVAYELHSDPSKPSVSGNPSSAKDHSGIPMPPQPMPPMIPAMRNKKRAAMANPPLPPPQSAIHAERHLKAKAEQQYYSRMLATAPHMLGNELNPDSGAAARLQEQLNAELAAHAVGGAGPDPVVPPPLINRAAPGSSGRSSGAQSLDQLLERQWEQGSQFLMEQAQHFDIASLLSCLHQLRTENVRLEEHVSNLLQRRDHLLAVNARLAIQLNSGGVTDASYQLTFQAAASAEPPRCSRDNGPPSRPAALEQPRCSRGDSGPPIRPPPPPARPAEAGSLERDRHTERAQVAQQVSHQMLMREVQQKPS